MSDLVSFGCSLPDMTESEFQMLSEILGDHLGFRFSGNKKAMLAGRLAARVRVLGVNSFEAYAQLLCGKANSDELQVAVNLVTTNETRFFREPEHFDFLRQYVLPKHKLSRQPLRVWSAACSSGQEPYSIAMVLSEVLGFGFDWQVSATDISEKVLMRARQALYSMDEAKFIPPLLLHRYGLRGHDQYEGFFLIDRAIRERVHFRSLNLMQPLPDDFSNFDVIFLRNVMIYFEVGRKNALVTHICDRLKLGGILIVGLAELIAINTAGFKQLRPSVYERV